MASTSATTSTPSDNDVLRSTVVNDDHAEGSKILVEFTVKRYYAADAEVDNDSMEYNILYCPTTGKGIRLPCPPGHPLESLIKSTAQTGTGAPESSSRGDDRSRPTYDQRGKAVQRAGYTGSAPPNCKFMFDLNELPPMDEDDDENDMGDIRPGWLGLMRKPSGDSKAIIEKSMFV